jgi:hypothetical protein
VGCATGADEPATRFSLLSADHTGITFQQNLVHDPLDITGLGSGGNGLAVGDLNGDGLPELFFTGGNAAPALYLNLGNLKFKDVSAQSGIDDLKDKGKTLGVTMADVNGDGLLDIYILKGGLQGNAAQTMFTDYGGNLLFINQGNLTFREQSKQYNLNVIGNSTAANFFDYDNDGDLDVYISNMPEPGRTFDLEYYKSPPSLKWYRDRFLENKGGLFDDVTETVGILNERNLGQSISVADVNNDGWLDVFVANDFYGRDFLYLNNGNKTFTESGKAYFHVGAMSAMGSDFADINHDGYMDLFVGEMMPETNYRQKLNLTPFSLEIYTQLEKSGARQYTRNMLYLNNEGVNFSDIGLFAGVEATEWSWGSIFADMDNDGNTDLYVANGIKRDMTNMDFIRNQYDGDLAASSDPKKPLNKSVSENLPSVVTPNYAFKNMANLTFDKVADEWGLSAAVHSRNAALADLDNDGDLDLILNNIDTIPYLYQNHTEHLPNNNYIRLRLQGDNWNTYGLGAKVWVYTKGKVQVQQLSSTKGFSSSPEPVVHFGLDSIPAIDSIKVSWLGGKEQLLANVAANQLLVVKQADAKLKVLAPLASSSTLLSEVETGHGIAYAHTESDFNDFKSFRIHHRKISAEGPCLVAGDVNGDGLDDFYIGGAKGSLGALYLQVSSGGFRQVPFPDRTGYEDVAAAMFDANGDGYLDLVLGSGSLEFEDGSPFLQDVLYLNNGKGNFTAAPGALPKMLTSTSTIATNDYDNDGDIDLFIGSRVSQVGYPKAPRSYLLQNEGGKFVDVTASIAPALEYAGMVTSALFSDYNDDGFADLIVVGAWMPITIFENKGGKSLEPIVAQGLADTHGWWNAITAADMDNDGDMDYVAGNWGANSFFKASLDKPVLLYANDFDGNGTIDPVVFRNVNGVVAPFVNRDLFCSQMPFYNNQYYSFEKYANATLDNMFTDKLKASSLVLKATEMRSSYVENIGDGQFKVSALPNVAQLAPVYGIQLLDVNEDGNKDIILAGNTSDKHFESGPRYGFNGLVLLGNGKGRWQPTAVSQSGFYTPGEAKAMVVLNSGKLLLVSRNNTTPKLFRIGPTAP